jgi:hypothetical protein
LPEPVPAPRVRFSDECKVQSPGEGMGVDSYFSVLDVVHSQQEVGVQEEEVGGDGEAAESVQGAGGVTNSGLSSSYEGVCGQRSVEGEGPP